MEKCCLARISVGHMYATWRWPLPIVSFDVLFSLVFFALEVMIAYAVAPATAVLPEPTSPSSRRDIGLSDMKSFKMAKMAFS